MQHPVVGSREPRIAGELLLENGEEVLVHVQVPLPHVLLALVEPPRFRHHSQSTAIVVDVSSSQVTVDTSSNRGRRSSSWRSKQSACYGQSTTGSSRWPVSTRSTLPTPRWSSS